jgi:hypothetical protein
MFDKVQYTISASASPAPGGTISGDGQYDCGSQVTLTANPGSCYTFVNWTENGTQVSTSATYSFGATANRTLVANFGKNGYIISASASPSGGGTVTGGGGYSCGSQATVTAHANSGYQFFNWTENGNVVSTSATYTFTVTGNRTLVANFKRPTTQISASGAISRPNNKQATFSYGYKVGQRTTSTAFNYRDPGSNVSISTNAVGSVTFSFNHVHVTGTYKVGTSTRSFVADFADNGPNGAGDQFSISVSPGGYSASGNLISGDIYIH